MKLKEKFNRLDNENRFYQLKRPIIALTGSIATGKSSVTQYLRKKGIDVICADELVKRIYATQEAIDYIKKECPIAIKEHIDFKILRREFLKNNELKSNIENFIYGRLEKEFKEELKHSQQTFIVYDIPLLFEKNLQNQFDLITLVYASPEIQIQRLLKRDQVSKEQALKIINIQMPIDKKKTLSEIIIENNQSLEDLHQSIDHIIGTVFE